MTEGISYRCKPELRQQLAQFSLRLVKVQVAPRPEQRINVLHHRLVWVDLPGMHIEDAGPIRFEHTKPGHPKERIRERPEIDPATDGHVEGQHPGGCDGQLHQAALVCADAVGSRRPVDYAAAVERIRQAGAIITTTESVTFELLGRAGTETFKKILPIVK